MLGISQIDLAILLPAFAAAWNLAGEESLLAAPRVSGRCYRSSDGSYTIEVPSEWELNRRVDSNELTFLNGEVSVSVATEEGDSVDQFLEISKALVRSICPAAELWSEGGARVAGAPGGYFTMSCPSPLGRTIVRVSAALSNHKLFVFKMAAPCAELYAVEAIVNEMAASFKASDKISKHREPRRRAC